jgi:hypothetical protein
MHSVSYVRSSQPKAREGKGFLATYREPGLDNATSDANNVFVPASGPTVCTLTVCDVLQLLRFSMAGS